MSECFGFVRFDTKEQAEYVAAQASEEFDAPFVVLDHDGHWHVGEEQQFDDD